jgi:hypothetical protein
MRTRGGPALRGAVRTRGGPTRRVEGGAPPGGSGADGFGALHLDADWETIAGGSRIHDHFTAR